MKTLELRWVSWLGDVPSLRGQPWVEPSARSLFTAPLFAKLWAAELVARPSQVWGLRHSHPIRPWARHFASLSAPRA